MGRLLSSINLHASQRLAMLASIALLTALSMPVSQTQAGELNGFSLVSTGQNKLTVQLNTDAPVAIEKEVTASGQVLHLKQTQLSDTLAKQGAPLVVDSANRYIGRVVPEGHSGLKIILPNVSSQTTVQVIQKQSPKTKPTSIQKPVLSSSTQKALQGQFDAAAQATIAQATQNSDEPATYQALPAVDEREPLTAPSTRPAHTPPPRYQVSKLGKSRVTHVTLPSNGQPSKTTAKNEQWKPVKKTDSTESKLPQVVPMEGAGVANLSSPYTPSPQYFMQGQPQQVIPGYPSIADWQAVVQQAPLAQVAPTPKKQINWFAPPPPEMAVSLNSPGSEDEMVLQWDTENPYGLAPEPEAADETLSKSEEEATGLLAFMDQVTGDTFSKPYGVAFWGMVIALGCLGCLGFLALAIGALCARFIFSPPSLTVQSTPVMYQPGHDTEEMVALTPMAEKYLRPKHKQGSKKPNEQPAKANSKTIQSVPVWRGGVPINPAQSLYHTSPIAKQAEATQKRHLLRRRLKTPTPPTNVAAAIEDALRLKL